MLGPFEARIAGERLRPLRSGKGLRLLALLALREEAAREWLAETLWPDSFLEQALASLRQSLADLRKALGEEGARLETPTVKNLRLNLSGMLVDVRAFDDAIRASSIPDLEQAAKLYRGQLLEGWSDPWVFPEREARQSDFRKALQKLAEHSLSAGDESAAVEYLRQATVCDPLQQEVHRTLMSLLLRRGDEAGAMDVYQKLRQWLREEYNAEPEPATVQMYTDLRSRARRRASSPAPRDPVPAEAPVRVPLPLSGMIGREDDLRELGARVTTARLVTLTGPGGVGKTRLATEAAREAAADYAFGCFFVDLSATVDQALAPQEIAAVLAAPEEPGKTRIQSLKEWIGARPILIVLDNCEQIVTGCASLAAELLRSCPALRILATSRQRLGVAGEVVFQLLPLPLPEESLAAGEMASCASVQLFLERAQAVRRHFTLNDANAAAIGEICRRLDGLPLALELAAPLVEILSPAEIAARLNDRFDLLVDVESDRPFRHQALSAMIDWSYELLSPAEESLLRQLSVFAGGWTLEAAEEVCTSASDARGPQSVWVLLSRLSAKSLISVEEQGETTWYRLLESIREYSDQRLRESGEESGARARHQQFYEKMALAAEPELTGPQEANWLASLEREHENLRAAIRWGSVVDPSAGPEGAGARSLRIAAALGRFWQIKGYYSTGQDHLNRALDAGPIDGPFRVKALSWSGMLLLYQGDYDSAVLRFGESAALARSLGDQKGLAGALGCLGIAAKDRGDLPGAREFFMESVALAEFAGDAVTFASSLGYLGIVTASLGEFSEARAYYERSLALRQEMQDRWGIAASMNNLGLLARAEGHRGEARQLLEQSLAIRRALGDRRAMAITLNNLGAIALEEADRDAARRLFTESLDLCRTIGDRRSVAYSLEAFARLAVQQQPESAAVLFGAASGLRERLGLTLPASETKQVAEEVAHLLTEHTGAQAAWERGRNLPLEEAVEEAQRGGWVDG